MNANPSTFIASVQSRDNVSRLPCNVGTLDGDKPWIPDGEYELGYLDYSTFFIFRVPKVVVRFKVLTFGDEFEKVVERWYRVKKIQGHPRRYGNFTVGSSSDCFREFCRLNHQHRRKDRISYASIAHKIVIGRVRSVTIGSNQRELPEQAKYSVIAELLRTET